MVHLPSPEEISAKQTKNGGWTKATLAEWGVPWPPPKGWRRGLNEEYERLHGKSVTRAKQVDDRPLSATPGSREDFIALADCPTCEALSGEPCHHPDGYVRRRVHFARMQAAQHIRNRMDEQEAVFDDQAS